MKNHILEKTKSLLISMRFKTTPLAMISVYIGGLVAGSNFYDFNLFLAMIVSFIITGGSMTFNDYFDWEIDKINHPERPIPKGVLKPSEMLYFSIFLFMTGLLISYFINILCFSIVIISLGLLVLYEKFSKNMGISGNITVAFTSSIAFTFGGAAVYNPLSSLILSLIAFFIMVSREIIMDIRDSAGDKKFRKTLPNLIGKKPALHVATIFMTVALILSPFPYILKILNYWYLVAIIPVVVISLFAVLHSYIDLKNVDRAASLIRIAFAIGLLAFVVGAVL